MALPASAGTPGRKSLQKIQIGLEATNGTKVLATKIMRVPGGVLSDDRQVTMVDEMVGIINGTDRSYISAAQSSISIDNSPLTPQQFPLLMAAALGFDTFTGRTTPVSGEPEGTGTAYRYTTTFPTTTAPADNNSYTIEAGDDFEQEYTTYGKCTSIGVSGSSGGPVTMQGSFMGRDVKRLSAGFSAATVDTVEDLIFARSKLRLKYPADVAFTDVDATFLGFDIGLECTWVPKFTGEGTDNTVPTWEFALWTNYSLSGSFTIEHNNWASGASSPEGLKYIWRNQLTLIAQIDIIGSVVLTTTGSTLTDTPLFPTGTAGQTYTGVRFEMPIKIQQVSPLSDNDGNDIVSVSWVGRYNSVYGGTGYTATINALAAVI